MVGADRFEPPACIACGVCCFSRLERYVRVRGDDYARLGADADELVVFHGNEAYMRMEDGHCAALAIDPASPTPFLCRVYERRPEACRALGRGSAECAGEIATKGDRPRVFLALVRPAGAARRS
jgi:Fe-S-cluster containining protein